MFVFICVCSSARVVSRALTCWHAFVCINRDLHLVSALSQTANPSSSAITHTIASRSSILTQTHTDIHTYLQPPSHTHTHTGTGVGSRGTEGTIMCNKKQTNQTTIANTSSSVNACAIAIPRLPPPTKRAHTVSVHTSPRQTRTGIAPVARRACAPWAPANPLLKVDTARCRHGVALPNRRAYTGAELNRCEFSRCAYFFMLGSDSSKKTIVTKCTRRTRILTRSNTTARATSRTRQFRESEEKNITWMLARQLKACLLCSSATTG